VVTLAGQRALIQQRATTAIGPAASGHGRDGDAGLVDLRHKRVVGLLSVAIAEQDDVLDLGVRVLRAR
jgi:hypothetical protein